MGAILCWLGFHSWKYDRDSHDAYHSIRSCECCDTWQHIIWGANPLSSVWLNGTEAEKTAGRCCFHENPQVGDVVFNRREDQRYIYGSYRGGYQWLILADYPSGRYLELEINRLRQGAAE